MNQKILFILMFFLISSSTLFGQVKKEVRIFKDSGPDIEVIEDDDVVIEDDEFIDPPMMRMIEKLDLSDAQEKEFRKLKYELQKKQTELQAKIRTSQIEMMELMDAEKIDQAAVEKKFKEISDLRMKLQLNRLEHWFKVNKILDEKQQKIWKKHFLLNEPRIRMMKFIEKGEKIRERHRIR